MFAMPTTNEKKALWFLTILALSGTTVRMVRGTTPELDPADSAGVVGQLERVDSVRALRHRTPARRRTETAKPSKESPLNLDSASADQIEALPGIGPSLARRIVSHRDSAGGLGHIDALCEVPGVRADLRERLRPLVTFTAPRRPVSVECGDASKRTRKSRESRARRTR